MRERRGIDLSRESIHPQVRISGSNKISEGVCALVRNGKVIFVGKLGDPIEDVEFDGLILSVADYERAKKEIPHV